MFGTSLLSGEGGFATFGSPLFQFFIFGKSTILWRGGEGLLIPPNNAQTSELAFNWQGLEELQTSTCRRQLVDFPIVQVFLTSVFLLLRC